MPIQHTNLKKSRPAKWAGFAHDIRHAQRQLTLRKKYLAQSPTQLSTSFFGSVLAPKKTILFVPQVPSPGYVVYKLCALAGYKVVSDPERHFDIAFRFHDRTISSPNLRETFAGTNPMINDRCNDISKKRVGTVFHTVFGYPLLVDPFTYRGVALVKSDENSTHDGHMVQCPLPALDRYRQGVVFEKTIDNETPDGLFLDYRVPVFGDSLPLVYMKYRTATNRFSEVAHSKLASPESVFSERELEKIKGFATAMGLDCGELDILRDNADGKIYIVDTNNTPFGPFHGVSLEQQKIVLPILTRHFEKLVDHFLEVGQKEIEAPSTR